MTPLVKAGIEEMLQKTRNPYEISRLLQVSPAAVRSLMHPEALPLPGWGKVEMQKHIVSRRRVNANRWPETEEFLLIEQRRLHDQGRVTMCQGRDADWIIQYSIPHRGPVPIRRNAYFYGC